MSQFTGENQDYIIHGMMCSYFTKKLEAYFLVKGIPYRFVEVDAPDYVQTGRKVGVTQIPQVQTPDGSWITDTTPIIRQFEADKSLQKLNSSDQLTAFCSAFIEDCFDEWYWTPAMYYRWAFNMDCKRRSEEFTYSILANGVKLPNWLWRKIIIWRQKKEHLEGNGIVSPAHARLVEDQYIETLDLLQPILKARPFLFGERPCNADFGMFGPMFPHFGCDPTPQEIMHVRAPSVALWMARLWSTRPEDLKSAKEITAVPEDLVPLIQKLAREYLPYLIENQKAFEEKENKTRYQFGGLDWEVPTAPYRVYCLTELQRQFQALDKEDQERVAELMGTQAVEILGQEVNRPDYMENISASNPARLEGDRPVGRHWQSAGLAIDKLTEDLSAKKTSLSVPELKKEGTDWLPIYFRQNRAKSK